MNEGSPPLSLRDCIFDVNKYIIGDKIYAGNICILVRAKDKHSGEEFAIKQVQTLSPEVQHLKKFLKEIIILDALKDHPNISRLIEFGFTNGRWYTLIGKCSANLRYLISNNYYQLFSAKSMVKLIHQVISAVAYMHQFGIVHTDIKPESINIFYLDERENMCPQLCEFSQAAYLPSYGYSNQKECRLLFPTTVSNYKAPEVLLLGEMPNAKHDVWSLGCLIAEIFLLRPIFDGRSHLDQIKNILHILNYDPSQLQFVTSSYGSSMISILTKLACSTEEIEEKNSNPTSLASSKFGIIQGLGNADSNLPDLLLQMLAFEPSGRPTASSLLEHSLFSKLEPYSSPPLVEAIRVDSNAILTALCSSNQQPEQITQIESEVVSIYSRLKRERHGTSNMESLQPTRTVSWDSANLFHGGAIDLDAGDGNDGDGFMESMGSGSRHSESNHSIRRPLSGSGARLAPLPSASDPQSVAHSRSGSESVRTTQSTDSSAASRGQLLSENHRQLQQDSIRHLTWASPDEKKSDDDGPQQPSELVPITSSSFVLPPLRDNAASGAREKLTSKSSSPIYHRRRSEPASAQPLFSVSAGSVNGGRRRGIPMEEPPLLQQAQQQPPQQQQQVFRSSTTRFTELLSAYSPSSYRNLGSSANSGGGEEKGRESEETVPSTPGVVRSDLNDEKSVLEEADKGDGVVGVVANSLSSGRKSSSSSRLYVNVQTNTNASNNSNAVWNARQKLSLPSILSPSKQGQGQSPGHGNRS